MWVLKSQTLVFILGQQLFNPNHLSSHLTMCVYWLCILSLLSFKVFFCLFIGLEFKTCMRSQKWNLVDFNFSYGESCMKILILLQFVLPYLVRAIFFECIINWLFDSILHRQLFHVRKRGNLRVTQSRSCDKDEDGVELDPDPVRSVYLLIMSRSQQLLSYID